MKKNHFDTKNDILIKNNFMKNKMFWLTSQIKAQYFLDIGEQLIFLYTNKVFWSGGPQNIQKWARLYFDQFVNF